MEELYIYLQNSLLIAKLKSIDASLLILLLKKKEEQLSLKQIIIKWKFQFKILTLKICLPHKEAYFQLA
jgi:hypothetical protein